MPRVLKITDQEWLFAYEFVTRGDPIRALDVAYPKAKSRPTHHKMELARRIMRRRRVDDEIRTIQNDLRSTQRMTIDQHLTILADIRDEARQKDQFAAAVRAEELRGRAAGFYFEQHIHITENLSREEMKARLSMILEENPHIKELLESQATKKALIVEQEPILLDAPDQETEDSSLLPEEEFQEASSESSPSDLPLDQQL